MAGATRRARSWRKFTTGFTEGFDTADLKDAKALLEDLAPQLDLAENLPLIIFSTGFDAGGRLG